MKACQFCGSNAEPLSRERREPSHRLCPIQVLAVEAVYQIARAREPDYSREAFLENNLGMSFLRWGDVDDS